MNCEYYRDLIFQKLDGEISPEDESSLKAHLDECEQCKIDYLELSQIENILQEQKMLDMPEGFSEALINKIRGGSKKKKKFIKPYFTIAAACVLLVVALCSNAFDTLLSGDKGLQDNSAPSTIENQTNSQKQLIGDFSLNDEKDSNQKGSDTNQTQQSKDSEPQQDNEDLKDSSGPEQSGATYYHRSIPESENQQTGDTKQAQTEKNAQPNESATNDAPDNASDALNSNTSGNIASSGGGGSSGASEPSGVQEENTGTEPQTPANGINLQGEDDNYDTIGAPQSSNSFAPAPDNPQSSYYAVASFSISSGEVDVVLNHFANVQIEPLVFEFSKEEFKNLCTWLDEKGLSYQVELSNENSETVLVLITAK